MSTEYESARDEDMVAPAADFEVKDLTSGHEPPEAGLVKVEKLARISTFESFQAPWCRV